MQANIFKAYDIRGEVDKELTPELAQRIGQAFAVWLPENGVVAVGRDMRPDSQQLAQAFIDGLRLQGRDVWDLGLVTSDMVYFAVGKYDLAGGAVITASHNPGKYNGIKLYRDKATPVGLDSGLDKIRDLVLGQKIKISSNTGRCDFHNIINDWIEHCLGFIKTIKPFNIAIDAGNGMAGAILPQILPKLSIKADELYFELDGTFPNHPANPQDPKNLQDLINAINKNGLDFGIAFDGDGDRCAFVDDLGRPVLGTDLLTIIARYFLSNNPNSEIVYDVRTSRATVELIKKWGGKPVRCKAGRTNIGKMLRERQAPFGGETTGHLFYKDNYDADSGLISALVAMQAISDSNKKLSELVNEYRLYVMPAELNFKVENSSHTLEKVRASFADGQQDNLDGLTVNYPDFWFNLRVSNTEPLIRLNIEAKDQITLDTQLGRLTKIIKGD